MYAWGLAIATGIVGNATVADWTEGGRENDVLESDAATAVANAKASISGAGSGFCDAVCSSHGGTSTGGKVGESALLDGCDSDETENKESCGDSATSSARGE